MESISKLFSQLLDNSRNDSVTLQIPVKVPAPEVGWDVLSDAEINQFYLDHSHPGLTESELKHQKWLSKMEITKAGSSIILEIGPRKNFKRVLMYEVPHSSKILLAVAEKPEGTRNIWLKDTKEQDLEMYLFQAKYPEAADAIASRWKWMQIIRLAFTAEQLSDEIVQNAAHSALRLYVEQSDDKPELFTQETVDFVYLHTGNGSRLCKVVGEMMKTALLDPVNPQRESLATQGVDVIPHHQQETKKEKWQILTKPGLSSRVPRLQLEQSPHLTSESATKRYVDSKLRRTKPVKNAQGLSRQRLPSQPMSATAADPNVDFTDLDPKPSATFPSSKLRHARTVASFRTKDTTSSKIDPDVRHSPPLIPRRRGSARWPNSMLPSSGHEHGDAVNDVAPSKGPAA